MHPKPSDRDFAPEARTSPRAALRRMVAADLDEVDALQQSSFSNPWSLELLQKELANEWSTVLLAEETAEGAARRILGFVIFWLVHDEVHILNVAVAPARRREGLARTLLAECLAQGRSASARLATLEVRGSNVPALSLYRSLGFRQAGVRKSYYVDNGEDAVVMVLDFPKR